MVVCCLFSIVTRLDLLVPTRDLGLNELFPERWRVLCLMLYRCVERVYGIHLIAISGQQPFRVRFVITSQKGN